MLWAREDDDEVDKENSRRRGSVFIQRVMRIVDAKGTTRDEKSRRKRRDGQGDIDVTKEIKV